VGSVCQCAPRYLVAKVRCFYSSQLRVHLKIAGTPSVGHRVNRCHYARQVRQLQRTGSLGTTGLIVSGPHFSCTHGKQAAMDDTT